MGLQSSWAEIEEHVPTSAISSALHRASFYERMARRKSLLRKVMLGNLRAFGIRDFGV